MIFGMWVEAVEAEAEEAEVEEAEAEEKIRL
jgi:hypothetical protein